MLDIDDNSIDLIDVQIKDSEVLIITAEKLLEEAGSNLSKKSQAINEICTLLVKLRDPVKANLYIGELAKRFKIAKKVFNDRIKDVQKLIEVEEAGAEVTDEPIPEGIDLKFVKRFGFWQTNNSYYFILKEGNMRGSNFVINPLFHIYSKNDNKRLVEITNDENITRIIDIPSKNLVSIEQFQAVVFAEGNFLWFGNKSQYLKILEHISKKFPVCNELRTLGWQKEGFFAFANGIFADGVWQPVDKFGITEFKGQKYFSPAFSSIYADVREDDDEYENDRFFIYRKSPVSLAEWGKLMIEVYGSKAKIAVAFAIASIFRDLIYDKYKCFPHLFLFGEKQSGKSQLAWSLSNLFFNNLPAFNLNSGTQVGFHRSGSRIKNGLTWKDEYTNDIQEPRFQGLKSAFDGIGHEKGRMTNDSRTSITKVNSATVISGQYLPTRDDNALFTQSILLSFEKKRYSAEETEKFERLKSLELQGLSSLICDILLHREAVEMHLPRVYTEIMDQIKDDMVKFNQAFDERLIRNFCSVIAVIKILEPRIDLGFTFKDAYDLTMEMLPSLTMQISTSESLSNFWSMVEYLLDNRMIEHGKDFIIKAVSGINVVNNKGLKESKSFMDAKTILFIRFSKIHPLYMEAHRKQFGKNGVDLVSLMHYIKHHAAYLGYIDSYRFDHSVSSCYCFDYTALNANLERLLLDAGSEPVSNVVKDLPF